eukprot:SAG11_NODE_2294_length_3556_cov_3.734741_5_plen_139_part_00
MAAPRRAVALQLLLLCHDMAIFQGGPAQPVVGTRVQPPPADGFHANCSAIPPAQQPAPDLAALVMPPGPGPAGRGGAPSTAAPAKRIRWFVGNSANWGCLLSEQNYSDITDGVIQCCTGVGFNASGEWIGELTNHPSL